MFCGGTFICVVVLFPFMSLLYHKKIMDKYFFDVFVGIVGTAFLAQPIFLVMVGLKLISISQFFPLRRDVGVKLLSL